MKLRVIITLLLLTSFLFAQQASKREWSIFQKGVDDYKSGQYNVALNDFQLVLSKVKDNSLLTAHRLMLAKSYYKAGEYMASLDECNKYIKEFPDSRYVPHIQYLTGSNYYRLDRLQTAVGTWLELAHQNKDTRVSEKALQLADKTVRFRLDEQGLGYLQNQLQSAFAQQFVLYHLAERDYEKGNFPPALATLGQVLDSNGRNKVYEQKARKLHDYLSNKKSSAIRIAALLPLSGASSEVGQAIFDGANMAVDQFNREHGPTIELVPFDYETRLTTALHKLREIARDPSINAIFGPIENDITAACAALAEHENIPIISPTATEKDLRTLSSQVVQLSVPMDITVQKLARYAQDTLNMKRLATIAPIDDYFVRMTQIFVQKQEQLDNTIVAQEWYYPGDQDITPRFKAIKRVGLKLFYQDSVLTEDSTLTQVAMDSMYKVYQKEQREILEETNTKIDSADIPITTIDGLFMPLFSDDISVLASQYAYWNVQAQVLGNADWYDVEALKKNKNYINDLIFVSDGYLNTESWDYRKFRNDFRDTYKRTPEKYEIIGYDSFRFVLVALEGAPKNISRNSFFERIKSAPLYNGVYRNFEVGKKRFNDASRILKFTYGQILPLK